jgi:hypothetical protein
VNVSRPGPGQVRQAGSGRRPGTAPWPAGRAGLSVLSCYHFIGAQPRCLTWNLNLAPAAQDMPDMALALIRAIIAAADPDRDEMTVLLIHGEPAAVIAPYGHDKRPGAAAGIGFDQTAPPEARLVLTGTWGGSIRMSAGEFRQLAREGVSHASKRWRRSRNPGREMPGADPGPPQRPACRCSSGPRGRR